jgi:NTP pyrophosphatase (non-canonical NTP hydrolase)
MHHKHTTFLRWIRDRLEHVHGENPDAEYMHRLEQVIKEERSFDLRSTINTLMCDAHETAVSKGFWDTKKNDAECIALMHSELSEALEALRKGNPRDRDCPDHGNLEIELADTIIRILDYSRANDLDLAGAILAKMRHNKTRPHKHGKEF